MKKDVVLLVYGTGGHKEQMRRLRKYLRSDIEYVAISTKKNEIEGIIAFRPVPKLREDYGIFLTIINIVERLYAPVAAVNRLMKEYNIRVAISTGSGIAIIPFLVCRLRKCKTVFFESWSRFTIPSISGMFLYRITTIFFIQNMSLKKRYPRALYCGRL